MKMKMKMKMKAIEEDRIPYISLDEKTRTMVADVSRIMESHLGLTLKIVQAGGIANTFDYVTVHPTADETSVFHRKFSDVWMYRDGAVVYDSTMPLPDLNTTNADLFVRKLNNDIYIGSGIYLRLPEFQTASELKMKLDLMNETCVERLFRRFSVPTLNYSIA